MEEQGVPLARWLMNPTSTPAEIPRIHDEVDPGDLAAFDREHESRPNLTAPQIHLHHAEPRDPRALSSMC
jgi:hypothetical protein